MLFLFVPVLLFCGCSSATHDNATRFPSASEHATAVPFSTAEPERYQADVVVRTGTIERKFFIARDGERRRIDYDVDQKKHRAVLKTDRDYLIDIGRKVFAVTRDGAVASADDESVLHLLNQRHNAEFTEVGSENGLSIYRAEIDGSPASEVVLYIDPATNLPMKQEFYSIEGDRREMMYSVEMSNVALEPEASVFEIPNGFREVSLVEFKRRLRDPK